jgi:hypothetical protein
MAMGLGMIGELGSYGARSSAEIEAEAEGREETEETWGSSRCLTSQSQRETSAKDRRFSDAGEQGR